VHGRRGEFSGVGRASGGAGSLYSIGQGATMVSACWGVFVWREFAGAPRAGQDVLLVLMFIFFLLGLGAVALAPLY
jgi:glucose uptake protein